MKRLLTLLLIALTITFSVAAVDVDGPTKIVLNYRVIGKNITFRMITGSSESASVTEINFADISALNHNEPVYSTAAFKLVYSYSLPPEAAVAGGYYDVQSQVQYFFGNFRLDISCDGLLLNGRGNPSISTTFVRSSDLSVINNWPTISMDAGQLRVDDQLYGDEFFVRLNNISGDTLPAGTYTGAISIRMTTE